MEVSWGNQIIPLRKTAFEHYIKDMHQETKEPTAKNLDVTHEERLATKCKYNWGKHYRSNVKHRNRHFKPKLVYWNARVYSTSGRAAFYDQPSLIYESFSRINCAVFYTK